MGTAVMRMIMMSRAKYGRILQKSVLGPKRVRIEPNGPSHKARDVPRAADTSLLNLMRTARVVLEGINRTGSVSMKNRNSKSATHPDNRQKSQGGRHKQGINNV